MAIRNKLHRNHLHEIKDFLLELHYNICYFNSDFDDDNYVCIRFKKDKEKVNQIYFKNSTEHLSYEKSLNNLIDVFFNYKKLNKQKIIKGVLSEVMPILKKQNEMEVLF